MPAAGGPLAIMPEIRVNPAGTVVKPVMMGGTCARMEQGEARSHVACEGTTLAQENTWSIFKHIAEADRNTTCVVHVTRQTAMAGARRSSGSAHSFQATREKSSYGRVVPKEV